MAGMAKPRRMRSQRSRGGANSLTGWLLAAPDAKGKSGPAGAEAMPAGLLADASVGSVLIGSTEVGMGVVAQAATSSSTATLAKCLNFI